MKPAVVLALLAAGCASPPLVCPPPEPPAMPQVTHARPVVDMVDAAAAKAERAALAYFASPEPDPAVMRAIRERRVAVHRARSPAERRAAVREFASMLDAQGIR